MNKTTKPEIVTGAVVQSLDLYVDVVANGYRVIVGRNEMCDNSKRTFVFTTKPKLIAWLTTHCERLGVPEHKS